MGIKRSIAGSASKRLPISIRDMRTVFLHVFLGQTEINKKDFVYSFASTYKEVIWFDVSMKELSTMNILNSSEHLTG